MNEKKKTPPPPRVQGALLGVKDMGLSEQFY